MTESIDIQHGILGAVLDMEANCYCLPRRPFHEVFVPNLEWIKQDPPYWKATGCGVIQGKGNTPAEAIEEYNKAFHAEDGYSLSKKLGQNESQKS